MSLVQQNCSHYYMTIFGGNLKPLASQGIFACQSLIKGNFEFVNRNIKKYYWELWYNISFYFVLWCISGQIQRNSHKWLPLVDTDFVFCLTLMLCMLLLSLIHSFSDISIVCNHFLQYAGRCQIFQIYYFLIQCWLSVPILPRNLMLLWYSGIYSA